jgi:hypothetical protein
MALKGCLKKNNALNPRVQGIVFGSPTWARTRDLRINSPSLYRLSYQGIGAGTKSRTRDLLITSQLLYQLSYTGEDAYYAQIAASWQARHGLILGIHY